MLYLWKWSAKLLALMWSALTRGRGGSYRFWYYILVSCPPGSDVVRLFAKVKSSALARAHTQKTQCVHALTSCAWVFTSLPGRRETEYSQSGWKLWKQLYYYSSEGLCMAMSNGCVIWHFFISCSWFSKSYSSTGDFPRAWALLLEHIEASALSTSNEVSLAALKSFQEILHIRPPKKLNNLGRDSPSNSSSGDTDLDLDLVVPSEEVITRMHNNASMLERTSSEERSEFGFGEGGDTELDDASLWATAWRVWYNIGINSTKPPITRETITVPSQAFLTSLVQIFPALFLHIKPSFKAGDLQKLCMVLQNAVSVPVHADMSVFIIPYSGTDTELTSLQVTVLHALDVVQKVIIKLRSNLIQGRNFDAR